MKPHSKKFANVGQDVIIITSKNDEDAPLLDIKTLNVFALPHLLYNLLPLPFSTTLFSPHGILPWHTLTPFPQLHLLQINVLRRVFAQR
jgi:hypothetical protein